MRQRPFVYISALPRTGSTLVSEALSQLPYAYILLADAWRFFALVPETE